ncbi:MAG: MBL fold metallo-hydrolase [Ruminiclostridium sp.]|nr:MBL fold metallo-hydrolase [Ruminiclostridium sp.]
MKITFLGAAKTVTGSCYLIEAKGCKFLVDCGMFQGHSKEEALNQEPFPFNPAELDFVVLTHAHIDHSGRIPKLFVDGFKGKIYATKPTVELCAIMLPDSGHIQEFENEWHNRKMERAGQIPEKPLYTFQNAVDSIRLFQSVRYDEVSKLHEGVKVRFNDAGHILGSSIVELWLGENGDETKIVFSGDLGNKGIPILRDPTVIESADYLVIESTYGNRLHVDSKSKVDRFVDIISDTVKKGGNIIIPSFAVGRTQEMIYELNKHLDKKSEKYNQIINIPVFVDSPLAVSATQVFRNNLDCFDEEARAYIKNGDNPLDFPGLQFTQSADESRALNERKDSVIIISASGMCEAGRIKHHLKHNLWRKESAIVFVGYQAEGTLGRKLVDGAKRVKIFGEDISVNARVEMIEGFSGHADRDGLLEWIGKFNRKPGKIFIVHGEEASMNEFSGSVIQKFGIETVIPSKGDSFVINRKGVYESESKISGKATYAYTRLEVLDMLDRLMEELNEASNIVKNELKEEKDELEIDELKAKLKKFENSILDIIK